MAERRSATKVLEASRWAYRLAYNFSAMRPMTGRSGLPSQSIRDRSAQTQLLNFGQVLARSAQSTEQPENDSDGNGERDCEWPKRGIGDDPTRAGPGSGAPVRNGRSRHGTQHTNPLARMRSARLSRRQR